MTTPRPAPTTIDVGAPTTVTGLPESDATTLRELWQRWRRHHAHNHLLSVYYDGHRPFQDLGISIPPQMARTRAALGWPAKVVTALARKHVFEGFTHAGRPDPYDTAQVLAANSFDVELAQAITSAYKHSFSLLTVTAGDPDTGDPDVVIQARDAQWSSALWDQRRRCVSAALTIDDTDQDTGAPTGAVLYLPHQTWRLTRAGGRWAATPLGNTTGRVLVEPLVYDPQLSRPLGRSRITPEVRYLTDAAVRTLVRGETSAEFFSSPQRYVLGAEKSDFQGTERWSAIMARLQVLEPNENGDIPTVGQYPQMSMDPHLSMYRQLAQNLCAATNLPQSAVGLFADNPASAEAMQAAESALADEAETQWRVFAPALRRTLHNVVMVRDHLDHLPDDAWDIGVKWTPARYSSPSAAADYALKMVQAFPSLAGSRTLMRRAGLTEEDLAEIDTEQRRAATNSVLDRLTTPQAPPTNQTEEGGRDLKAAFEALGQAVRAGVDPTSALSALGLEDITMTGAVPVSLRLPQKEATTLEEA